MKKLLFPVIFLLTLLLAGCGTQSVQSNTPLIAVTTKPMATFTQAIAEGTDLRVETVVSESISCLHDYSLSVAQMKLIESADAVVISGAGLEDFMADVLANKTVINAADGVETRTNDEGIDPHIWLDPLRAKQMAGNISAALSAQYPAYAETFRGNLTALETKLDELSAYGQSRLAELPCRELVTFHDGFAYFAEAYHLTILAAMEEEAGSEISAADLAAVADLVRKHRLSAVFADKYGVSKGAETVAKEAGVRVCCLDTALGDEDYFTAMRQNIDTLWEALS